MADFILVVAQRITAKGRLTFSGCELIVTPFTGDTRVKISGVSEKTPKFALELFFENNKKSNGGEIKEIQVDNETAIITFEDAEGK